MLRTRLTSFFPLHLSPDAPAGGTGEQPIAQPSLGQRINKLAAKLIAQYGSEEGAITALARENLVLTDDLATAQTTIGQMRSKLPNPDKEVVLPKERVDVFNKFEALKISPEDVTKLQQRTRELEGTVHVNHVKELAGKGAPAIGFDPEATVDLVTGKQLHVELREIEREIEKGGKKEKVKLSVPFVRPAADEKAQLVPLDEFAKTLPAFEQRALKAQGTQQQQTQSVDSKQYFEQENAQRGSDAKPADAVLQNVRSRYPSPSEMKKSKEPANAA
jgi:hypothetical protein